MLDGRTICFSRNVEVCLLDKNTLVVGDGGAVNQVVVNSGGTLLSDGSGSTIGNAAGGTNTVTFEARLFESSNRILLSYFDTAIADAVERRAAARP